MPKPPLSSAWLSAEMARALAGSCPPLKTEDVVQGPDSLMNVRRWLRLYVRCATSLLDDELTPLVPSSERTGAAAPARVVQADFGGTFEYHLPSPVEASRP